MKITQNFGKRNGYLQETHVSFVVIANVKRRAGAKLDIFVEASVDSTQGIKNIFLRENGTNKPVSLEHVNKDELYELIIKQL